MTLPLNATPTSLEINRQTALDALISTEILGRAGDLVSDLLALCSVADPTTLASLSFTVPELETVLAAPDWEHAGRLHHSAVALDDEALPAAGDASAWHAFCVRRRVAAGPRIVLAREFLLVTTWLGARLTAQGASCARLAGFHIWGRPDKHLPLQSDRQLAHVLDFAGTA